jgi:probable phosphoglycerate mutase
MEMTEFTVFRHGQTADNLARVLQGHKDTPLDDVGRLQARCAALRIKGGHFDAVYSSDLRRAFETAQIIGTAVGLEPVPEKALREWHLGVLEGRPVKELLEKYPEIIHCFDVESGDLPVPGGEAHGTFEKRVTDCLDKLADAFVGKKIILVTHGGVMRAIFKHIVGVTAEGNMLPTSDNVSYNTFFRYADGRWRLRCWNDVSHLTQYRESVTF